MCDADTREKLEKAAAGKAINTTIAMVEGVLGQSVPGGGTPSERRDRLMAILRQRLP